MQELRGLVSTEILSPEVGWPQISIYIFRVKSYLVTKIVTNRNVGWKSMCRVVNEFCGSIADVESKFFYYREFNFLEGSDCRSRGER